MDSYWCSGINSGKSNMVSMPSREKYIKHLYGWGRSQKTSRLKGEEVWRNRINLDIGGRVQAMRMSKISEF